MVRDNYKGSWSTIFYCPLLHCAGQVLFALLCASLQSCTEELLLQQEPFLASVKSSAVTLVNDDGYLWGLQSILRHNVNIKEVFDQIQRTFRWKLLLDVMAITVSPLNKMVWISIYLLNPGDVAMYSMWSEWPQSSAALYLQSYLSDLRLDRSCFASLSTSTGKVFLSVGRVRPITNWRRCDFLTWLLQSRTSFAWTNTVAQHRKQWKKSQKTCLVRGLNWAPCQSYAFRNILVPYETSRTALANEL